MRGAAAGRGRRTRLGRPSPCAVVGGCGGAQRPRGGAREARCPWWRRSGPSVGAVRASARRSSTATAATRRDHVRPAIIAGQRPRPDFWHPTGVMTSWGRTSLASAVRGNYNRGGGRTGRPSCGVSKIGTSRAWSRCGGSPSASSARPTPTSAPRLDRRASWSFVGPESAGCSRPTLRTTTRDGRIEHCSCARHVRKRPSPSRSTAESDVRPIVGALINQYESAA